MKQVLVAASLAFVAWVALVAAKPPSDETKMHRVVFELTSGELQVWNSLLNNVENVRQALGPDRTEVEVVAHGGGLGLLTARDAQQTERMEVLAQAGVVFAACENTMRRQNVGKADLLPFVTTVDSGVAEIVRKQEAGWSYLRVGG